MQWEFVVAVVVAIPIILFPVAFIWYMNIGGIYAAIKKAISHGSTLYVASESETNESLRIPDNS
ncbi:hypothetical protein ACFLXC_02050 [Chloroflexota bacterium]